MLRKSASVFFCMLFLATFAAAQSSVAATSNPPASVKSIGWQGSLFVGGGLPVSTGNGYSHGVEVEVFLDASASKFGVSTQVLATKIKKNYDSNPGFNPASTTDVTALGRYRLNRTLSLEGGLASLSTKVESFDRKSAVGPVMGVRVDFADGTRRATGEFHGRYFKDATSENHLQAVGFGLHANIRLVRRVYFGFGGDFWGGKNDNPHIAGQPVHSFRDGHLVAGITIPLGKPL